MTTWRPASDEIDPLQEAVVNAARAAVLPIAEIDTPPPSSDGVREVHLRDGRVLRIALAARPIAQESRNDRPVAIYEIVGNAVVDRAGYRVVGQAVIDIVTKAFLDIGCRLESVGAVRT